MPESVFSSQTPVGTNNSDGAPGMTTATSVMVAGSGTISGVRFFATTTVSGTYTAKLWQVTVPDVDQPGQGTLLASKVMDGVPTGGAWNNVLFDEPVPVVAGTIYRVGIHSSAGRYVNTTNFFSVSGLTNGNVSAPIGDPIGGFGSIFQGTFVINADGTAYPNQQFGQASYFVDLLFDLAPASGQAAFSLPLALSTTGDAPGIDPGRGDADYGIEITLAALGETPGSGQGQAAFTLDLALAGTGAAELPRAIAPSEGSRLVYAISSGLTRSLQGKPNTPVTIYADSSAVSLADIRTLAGDVITGSVLTTDQWSQLPLFRMPEGADTVYGRVAGGPLWPIYAREDDRLDALESDVETLQASVRRLQAEVVPGLAADVAAVQVEVDAVDAMVQLIEDFVDVEVGVVRPEAGTTAYRPDPQDAGAGAMWFDVTLGRPIWSNGTIWVSATGTAV